jgi:hypothetical protein
MRYVSRIAKGRSPNEEKEAVAYDFRAVNLVYWKPICASRDLVVCVCLQRKSRNGATAERPRSVSD